MNQWFNTLNIKCILTYLAQSYDMAFELELGYVKYWVTAIARIDYLTLSPYRLQDVFFNTFRRRSFFPCKCASVAGRWTKAAYK